MNCFPPRKRKRKSKRTPVELTKLNKRWNSCDIDTEVIFSNGTNVDGFLGLEEIHDYNEDEIKEITNLHKKKKDHTQVDKSSVCQGNNKQKETVLNSINQGSDVNNETSVQLNDVISNVAITNDAITNDAITNDAITNDAISNDAISNDAISNDAISNDVTSTDVTSTDVTSTDVISTDLISNNVISNDQTDENIDCSYKGNKIIKLDKKASNDGLNEKIKLDENITKSGVSKRIKLNKNATNIEGSKEVNIKILSKKERRKQARKLSFKLKLKERRKKYKEMKKAKENEEVIVNKICDTVINKCESFEIKSNIRSNMSEWFGLGVPDEVMKALSDSNFTTPTPIQRECLPPAIFHRQDIIGAAETGSGKTLAFGIPLIKNIMELKSHFIETEERNEESDEREDTPLYALIITPTRELALQIKDHIQEAAKYADVQCVAVVGGLATAKQERLLSKCPEIVVGTPGRLHKLLTDGCEHLNKFESLKYLVIDEADRMLEHGHFKELNDILDMINRVKVKRQIFLFSATLALPQHHKSRQKRKKEIKTNESEMQLFIDQIGLNQKAKVIDLTPKHVTASQLQQLRVMCADEEKEIYLVYFLMKHPGRSIVFVNSISCTRRLCSLLNLLSFNPLQLHAGKQQRQRLKYLERFTASENGLLIATDVAARGLDIPKVCNVIHFQLPTNPKVYIHRAGRTARANESGLSFILEGPEDFSALKKISVVLKLGKDIPSLNVDRKILNGIKARIFLAREIEREEYKFRKENADNNWLKRTANSMDIETEEIEENVLTKHQKLRQSAKRKQLQKLLSEDLYPSGFSGCYPTQSGNLIVPGLQM